MPLPDPDDLPTADDPSAVGRLDDENYPAYSMGRAAELLGVTPAFLRALGEVGLLEPQRSAGGHRRYSRAQLRLAARARELADQGTALEAAARIIDLEDQLTQAHARNAELTRRAESDRGERSSGNLADRDNDRIE